MPQHHDLEHASGAHREESRADSIALTLDALSTMTSQELVDLYRMGAVPVSMRVLEGFLPGRILTLEGVGTGLASAAVRALEKSRLFPWIGKSFEATSDTEGHGTNRLRVLGARFPFDLRFDKSLVDEGPCISIDYDRPENPGIVRSIRDELREVSPGLFLGPSFMTLREGRRRRVLFFACEKR